MNRRSQEVDLCQDESRDHQPRESLILTVNPADTKFYLIGSTRTTREPDSILARDRIPRNIGRTAERILLGGRRRSRRRCSGAGDNFGFVAEHYNHAPFGIELDHQVRPFVDHPDVVFGIDAHRVREL